jgi:hypothetical protein
MSPGESAGCFVPAEAPAATGAPSHQLLCNHVHCSAALAYASPHYQSTAATGIFGYDEPSKTLISKIGDTRRNVVCHEKNITRTPRALP